MLQAEVAYNIGPLSVPDNLPGNYLSGNLIAQCCG